MTHVARILMTLLVAAACAPRVPTPVAGLHSGDEPAIVPYPPPAAIVEWVPARPAREALWLDGHWEWTGTGYAWQGGRWEAPPAPGAYYAPATTVRRPNGQLFYFTGRWHLADGTPVLPKEGT
jgi:hypothetical protein